MNMTKIVNGNLDKQYATWYVGLVFSILLLIIVVAHQSVSTAPIMPWIWLGCAVPLLLGLLLSLLSDRLLWVRLFQLMCSLYLAAFASGLLFSHLSNRATITSFALTSGAIILTCLGGGYLGYLSVERQGKPARFGTIGDLNEQTGMLDTKRAHQMTNDIQREYSEGLRIMYAVIPIAAGISMFLVNMDSFGVDNLLLSLIWYGFLVASAGSAGQSICYLRNVIRWESKQSKPSRLKR